MTKFFKTSLVLVLIILVAAFLRLYNLDKVPVSLFGDEVDLGYQAYSVLTTGRDYMGNFLPMHFQSLTEYRTSLYLYSAIPTVALFGVSPLGVRLPAAIFGILSILGIYLLVSEISSKKQVGLIAAAVLSITPWHLQYSRAGFEVTEMIGLYIFGIYFFLRSLKNGRWLIPAAVCLGLTPWVYSTAKLFLPLTVLAIVLIWGKQLWKLPRKYLIWSVVIFTLVVGPFAWNTVFGGGTQRIEGISIFTDPIIEGKIGFDRQNDIKVGGNTWSSLSKLFHNKVTVDSKTFFDNYFQAFSTDFLFINGDPNSRQSSGGGELYKTLLVFLILGFVGSVSLIENSKFRQFIFFWLIASPIPSALTLGGGTHATRLILMLPVLVILISVGIYWTFVKLKTHKIYFKGALIATVLLIGLEFVLYGHQYLLHYPWDSEKMWHAGIEEMVKQAVAESPHYRKVVFSMADEPIPKFFLGWSEYPPNKFRQQYPFPKQFWPGFGNVERLDNYYFTAAGTEPNLYELGHFLSDDSLYIATQKEVKFDLILEPQRVPNDLKLIKTILYPSGDPAFYFLVKK